MLAAAHPLLMPRAVGRTGPRLAAARFALAVALALLGVLALVSRAPALEQKLTPPGALFGYSAAIDGDTLVVGDPLDRAGVGARRSARSLFPVGRYRLVGTPPGGSGDKGTPQSTTLRIVRR